MKCPWSAKVGTDWRMGGFPLYCKAWPHLTHKKAGRTCFFFISYPFCLFIRRIFSVLLFLFLISVYYIVMYVCLLNLNKSEVVISSLCFVWHEGCICMIRCLNWVTLFFFYFFTSSVLFFFCQLGTHFMPRLCS